jgi:FkbM family methyltransferase
MIESLKSLLRLALRAYCQSGLRGSTRAINLLAPYLAPRDGVERVPIGRHVVPLDHRVRAMRLMAYGLYEPAECRHLPYLVPSGGIVFDVGANIGYLTAHFARAVGRRGRVYAFEPSPLCLLYLDAVASSNNSSNITVVRAAVADASRSGIYYETERVISHGFGRIDMRPSSVHRQITEHAVRIVSLDDFFDNQRLDHVDLVKIDVEGLECQVVEGMTRLFSHGQRPIVLAEVTIAGDSRQAAIRIDKTLRLHGYSSYLIKKYLVPVQVDKLAHGFHNNVLWMHERNARKASESEPSNCVQMMKCD